MAAEGLTSTQLADLVLCVTDNHPADKSFEYLRDPSYHTFELMNRIFSKEKIEIQGGENISRFVNYRESGTAEYVLPAKVYQPAMIATLKKITIPWRHAHGHWAIVREEMLGCRGPEQLIDEVKVKQTVAKVDMSILIESMLWAAPDATSEILPLTIPYWVVPYPVAGATAAGAQQGTFQSGYTDIAGLDPSDAAYTRWKNWNFQWSNNAGEWTSVDGKRMGRMYRHLQFEAPQLASNLSDSKFSNLRLYTNETTLESMEENAKKQNDQVGPDLGRYQGSTLYRGLPPVWQSQLDTYIAAQGYYPTYLINFAYLKPVVREGDYFREETFKASMYQPDVTVTHMDLSYNLLCTNRQLVGGCGSY